MIELCDATVRFGDALALDRVTERNVRSTFDLDVLVLNHPETNSPFAVPLWASETRARHASARERRMS